MRARESLIGRVWITFSIVVLLAACISVSGQTQQSTEPSPEIEQWKEEIRKKRSQILEQRASKATAAAPETSSEEGYIVINGKRIRTRLRSKPSDPAPVEAASAEIQGATPGQPAPAVSAPPPSPPQAKRATKKVMKIVDGKIITIEVEITPTPDANAGPIASATLAAAGPVVPATGIMAEIHQLLTKAAKSKGTGVRFEARLIAKMRDEFMKARSTNPQFDEILKTDESVAVQNRLQRLSSFAQGGPVDSETAKALISVFWPKPKPAARPVASRRGANPVQAAVHENQPQGPSANPQLPETEHPSPPQIYYDPNTGEYIYQDGTLVQFDDQGEPLPQQAGYGEEGDPGYIQGVQGGEVYYEEGQVYYEDEGVYYEDEGVIYEEGVEYIEGDGEYYDEEVYQEESSY